MRYLKNYLIILKKVEIDVIMHMHKILKNTLIHIIAIVLSLNVIYYLKMPENSFGFFLLIPGGSSIFNPLYSNIKYKQIIDYNQYYCCRALERMFYC